jgi:hypothetical protein
MKTDLKEADCEVMDWINLATVRMQWWDLANTAMKLNNP